VKDIEREREIVYYILAKGFEGMRSDDLALDTVESETKRVSIRRDIVLDGTRCHFSLLAFSRSLYLFFLLSPSLWLSPMDTLSSCPGFGNKKGFSHP
jgi:hypothetical protein